MADNETLNDGVEELAQNAEQATEAVEEQIEDVSQMVGEVADEQVDDATVLLDDAADVFDAKVETAVRNVAEEAEAEQQELVEAAESAEVAPEPAPKKRERRSKQARAEKAARSGIDFADKPVKASATDKLATLGVPAWIAISVACLALGLLLGRFALSGGSAAGGASLVGKTTVSESELDKACAVYTYNGKTNTLTVREVIEQNGTIDSAKTEDGTYKIPSAEYAINAARTAILNAEVESRGIKVTEEDATAYAEEALGTSDFDAIASTYGMDAEAVKNLIMENCRLNALREEVIGGKLPDMPTAPTTAEEGKEDEVTKEYAKYIIELAGDEWDSEKGKWASEDSAYATALEGSKFTADGASYNDAQSAYYVAYQLYSEKQNDMSAKWTEFISGLMSQATIQVGTLVS